MRTLTTALLLLIALPAAAQELSSAERARLQRVMRDGLRQYEAAAGESPAARENLEHVRRMLDAVDARREDLRRRGIDADVARAGILFSDLGKNGANMSALAQELFPNEYRNPATRGAAMFKAFLLHEVPGRRIFRETARQYGLSAETIERVERANVGHNGPGAAGSWWQGAWDSQIRSLERGAVRLDGPHGELVRQYVGRAYPMVQGLEGALHTALDRRDQGTRDGSLKIMAERMGRGETLREAFRATFGSQEGSNQRMTQLQFDALRERYPQVFEIDVVREAERAVQETARFSNHVQFNRAGDRARIHLPDGRVVEATSFESFREALVQVEQPSARRFRSGAEGGRPALSELANRTLPQLLAEARRRGVEVRPPYTRAALLSALTGASATQANQALARRDGGPVRSGAARVLERQLPQSQRGQRRTRR